MKFLFVLLYLAGLRRLLLLVVVLMAIAILQQHPVRWRGSSTDATALAPEGSASAARGRSNRVSHPRPDSLRSEHARARQDR